MGVKALARRAQVQERGPQAVQAREAELVAAKIEQYGLDRGVSGEER
jgi:hypothetical protein